MKHPLKSTFFLLLAAAALPLGAADGPVTFYDFEHPAGTAEVTAADKTASGFFRTRVNNNTKQSPAVVEDTPEVLKQFSRTSLELNRGLVWLKQDKDKPFFFDPAFSLSFWIKPARLPEKEGYFACGNKSWRLVFLRESGRLCFDNTDGGERVCSGKLPLTPGRWTLLTVTGAKGEIRFFCDGKPVGGGKLAKPVAPFVEIFLGAEGGHGVKNFEGRMDDFALFDRALPPAEIAALARGVGPGERAELPRRLPGVGELKRTITQPFPADFKGFVPKDRIDLGRTGAIVRAETGVLRGQEAELQAELKKLWGVELPVMSADAAIKDGKTLVLFGENRSNMPLRRLVEFCAVESIQRPGVYEARIYPQLLDYPAGVVYLGGRSMTEVLNAARRLAENYPDAGKLGFFIERQDRIDHRVDPEAVKQMVETVRKHLAEPDSWIPNQTVIRLFREAFALFLATGAKEYAEAVAAMQKIYLENYQKNIKRFDPSGPAPSFVFHEYVWKLEIVANSPHFTIEDRAAAAELMRQVAENCFAYYEMRKPMQDYAAGVRNYQTNHEIFCSRTVYFIADHLLRNYAYEPAKYWQAVAANTLAGVAPQPVSPEDSASYQYLNYQIFTTYVLASGKFDLGFFTNDTFKNYIAYCKAQYSHLGMTGGYGDNPPLGNASSFPALGTAVSVFGDAEAESLLALIHRTTPHSAYRSMIDALNVRTDLPLAMSDRLTGLAVFPVSEFILKFNQGDKLMPLPVLDKAFFRSGWTPDADFLVLSGLSDAPHGHREANAVIQYVHGGNIFLTDGDYLRKYPEEQNTVHVSLDGLSYFPESRWGKGRDTSRFGQIVFSAMLPDRKMAATATKVAGLNGVDWTRHIAYAAKRGFWAIDRLDVKTPGDYVFDCRWRALGDLAELDGSTVEVSQRSAARPDEKARLLVTGGDAERYLDTRFDTGHGGGENGYYADYPHAGPDTRNLLARKRGKFVPGDAPAFVSYLQVREPGDDAPPPRLHRIGEQAWLLIDGDVVRLAVLGKFASGKVEIAAASCFAGPEGLIADRPTAIRLGSAALPVAAGSTVLALPADDALRAALAGLRALANDGNRVVAQSPPEVAAPDGTAQAVQLPAAATALAAAGGMAAVGGADGTFAVYDRQGVLRFTKKLGAEISRIAVVPLPEAGVIYLVGTQPPTPAAGGAPAPLYCFDRSGNELWRKEIPKFQARNGTVKMIFPAYFSADRKTPTLIVGAENWKCYAIEPDGRERWNFQVYHGATAGVAADLDGDRIDEVFAGSEYYYSPILDAAGKKVNDRLVGPWVNAAIAADLDGDGRSEVIAGRSNHALDLHTVKGGSALPAESLPLGGEPTALVPVAFPGGAKFVSGARDGKITLFDGKLRRLAVIDLFAPVRGLAGFDGGLLAVAASGYLYRIGPDGRLAARYPAGWDAAARCIPPPVGDGDAAFAAIGKTLYLVTAR
jgi:hypothetical protein